MADRSGNRVVVSNAQVAEFASSLRGQLLREGDPGYDEARTLWNAMIDKRPALIARCAGPGNVTRAVDFARQNRIVVSVRGEDMTSSGTRSATGD